MPTIYNPGRYRVMIFPDDHYPVHVHIVAAEYDCKIEMDAQLTVVKGHLPPRTLRTVRRWLAANRDHVARRWEEII